MTRPPSPSPASLAETESWRVFGATSPHESMTATVEDGVNTDATTLITHGFTLSQDEIGALVVDAVSPDTPAWEAGDVVVGITMAGLSLDMDGEASALAQVILDRCDGPGTTPQVLGADGFEEIPLTWQPPTGRRSACRRCRRACPASRRCAGGCRRPC